MPAPHPSLFRLRRAFFGATCAMAVLLAGCGLVETSVSVSTPVPSGTRPLATLTASPAPPSPTLPPSRPAPLAASPTPQPSPTTEPSPTTAPSPTPTPELPVRFAVIGDYGAGGHYEEEVANLVKSWQPDFILTVGDNNYPEGSAGTIDANLGKFYHEYIYPYHGEYGEGADLNRFFPTLGNHDWIAPGAKPYFDYFELPGNERYYTFTWGMVDFFALDSDEHEPDGFRRDSPQAQWLQEQLAASDQPWRVVFFHHAPYSSGPHGSIPWMQWPFEAWGATVVLAGHDHTYERLMIGGIPYFVNGVGGGAIYNFEQPLEESLWRYNDNWGAMLVEATSTEMRFRFFTRHHELIDEYVQIRE